MPPPVPQPSWEHVLKQAARIREETARVIVGQNAVVEQMLTALLCRGHCLLVGVPGLAKTLLVSTLGKILGLKVQRIQFTPDLMPTDILGSEVLQETPGGGRSFNFVPGPIFANLILADEINRTPPKTQAALLEAMQEKQVTVAGKTRSLEEPFLVFATQNPIEHEGTYPLPEAQLDRFAMKLSVGYPEAADEAQMLRDAVGAVSVTLNEPPVLHTGQLASIQSTVADVTVVDSLQDYLVRLAHETRRHPSIALGLSPRGLLTWQRTAQARAWLSNRDFVTPDDVQDVAVPVLAVRFGLEQHEAKSVILEILEKVPVPEYVV